MVYVSTDKLIRKCSTYGEIGLNINVSTGYEQQCVATLMKK